MIEQKFNEIIALAERKYNIDLSDVQLRGDIKGYRMIGQAVQGKILRYSPAHLENNPEYYLNQIVPHEVAHIVCQRRPELGKNHDKWWRQVAISLGCDTPRATVPQGTFTLEEPTKKPRKTYKYIDTKGGEHHITGQRHALIQNKGRTYTVIDTQAELTAQGFINE